MQLYVSETDEDISPIPEKFSVVSQMEESDQVLILPGGLGALNDMLRSMDDRRDMIIYNKDMYYSSILRRMFQSYEKAKEEDSPFFYMDIESDWGQVIRKLEEKENGKTNNGETSKLL